MPTGEAAAMAEGQDPSARNKSSSPRHIPVIAVVTEDEETQGVFKSMDLNHVIKLLEENDKGDLEEKQLKSVKKLVQCYQNGLPLRDLAKIFKILNLCAGKIENQHQFVESVHDILKLCGLPFLKKKVSDEITYAEDTANSIALLDICNSGPGFQKCGKEVVTLPKIIKREAVT
ncbi:cilia- and flagella-associated protein 69-like isoform X2 [Heterocephalus glaber]|uniref:Cilia- and flagella-associated protein 69-like isoform X2 n=1 Tax=Heterocephalus glaber TaxID=10181 RepID=A0AAX6RNF2_HETGA|nr:cilia- and flagella-associated protein 69-like isoform X2 [Heterocephalus glaber]XP_021098312.1 cilia- and flagella-associated protein 69-like isoform X2 [Heterocephalus glaber]